MPTAPDSNVIITRSNGRRISNRRISNRRISNRRISNRKINDRKQRPERLTTAVPDWESTHTAGLAAFERQSYEAAVEYFKQSWALSRNPAQQGVSANDLGQAYRKLGRPGDAREWLERACDVWRAGPREGHSMAVAISSLGSLRRDAGDYAQAEALLREALGVRDPDPDSTAKIRYSLADLLREEGRIAEARQLFLETSHQDDVSSKQRLNALMGLAEIDRQADDRGSRRQEVERRKSLEMARSQHDEAFPGAIASRGLASM